MVYIKQRRK